MRARRPSGAALPLPHWLLSTTAPGSGDPIEYIMAKSYHMGWDTILPDPGEVESWDCQVCGDTCDVRRGVVGRRSSISPHESPHDSFTCPNSGEPWHDQALKIAQAIHDMPAPSIRALMEGDLAKVVRERAEDDGRLAEDDSRRAEDDGRPAALDTLMRAGLVDQNGDPTPFYAPGNDDDHMHTLGPSE